MRKLHTHAAKTNRAASFPLCLQVKHQSWEVKSSREVTGRFHLLLYATRVMALYSARHQRTLRPLKR